MGRYLVELIEVDEQDLSRLFDGFYLSGGIQSLYSQGYHPVESLHPQVVVGIFLKLC